MIRGVIFDMDGVMIDSERQSNEGWLWAAEQLGVEMPMWLIDSFKGAPNTLSCQFFDDYYHGKIDYWEARKLRTEHIYKIREKEGLPIKKGLFELLDYIRENGIKCAVATSTRRESAEKTLHTIGAASTIDRIIDVFPPNQQHQIAVQLSMVLQAVISQQLVPSIDEKMIPVF